MYEPKSRTQREIDDILDRCWEAEEKGYSRWPGMTYEQGVRAAINWLLDTGYDDYHPLED